MTENFAKGPIAVLYTGGTIGCTGCPLAPLGGRAFGSRWEDCAATLVEPVPLIETVEPALDSTDMTPEGWIRIARRSLALVEQGHAVVVLHGTDTLAWTAAALAMLSTLIGADGHAAGRLAAPLVLTGAQRPLFADGRGLRAGSDAPDNLVLAASAAGERRVGAWVAFGGSVLPAARVMKVDAAADVAFACPNGPATGDQGSDGPPPVPAARIANQLAALAPVLSGAAVLAVSPCPAAGGSVAATVEGAVDALGPGLSGVHLLGYGTGSMPDRTALAPVLRALTDRGIPVVAGTQVPRGTAAPATYEAGDWLADCGAWPGGDRTPAAIQVKLALLESLGALHGWDAATRRAAFDADWAGEGAIT